MTILTLLLTACASIAKMPVATITGLSTVTASTTPANRETAVSKVRGTKTVLAEERSNLTKTILALTPTLTPSETSTPSLTPTKTPTETPLPFPKITQLFPTPLDHLPGDATPTPINLPDEPAEKYALKDWSPDDALQLVQTMDQYAYAADVWGVMSSRFGFYNAQEKVRIAILEAFLRFPTISEKAQLGWRLAQADSLLGNLKTIPWIQDTIESGLNRGEFFPENLGKILELYGFEIADLQIAENLFGDGLPVPVYHLKSIHTYNDGIFFAIRTDAKDRYQTVLIGGDLAPFVGDFSASISDHNGNGLSEVTLTLRYQSGGFCTHYFRMFEWQGDRFTDLTEGQLDWDECDWSWEFERNAKTKNDDLVLKYWELFNYSATKRYEWDGEIYQLVQADYEPVHAAGIIALGWGDYSKAIETINLALENDVEDYKEDIGPSFKDYLRFQLGMAYAGLGDIDSVHGTLRDLADSPDNPEILAIPKAAEIFLKSYQKENDIYRSCKSARTYLDKLLDQDLEVSQTNSASDTMVFWGYEPYRLPQHNLCNLELSLRILIENLGLMDRSQLIKELVGLGVNIRYSHPVDLFQDGYEDQILLVETEEGYHPCERSALWVLLNTGQGFDLFRGDCLWHPESPEEVNISTFQLPGKNRVWVMVQLDDSFAIQQIEKNGQDITIDQIFDDVYVSNYEIVDQDESIELVLTYDALASKRVAGAFLWDEPLHDFQSEKNIEKVLFQDKDLPLAITLLQETINEKRSDEDSSASEYALELYLLGLAYELAEDQPNAILTYWTLWHEVPESPFAIMAREKLIPANSP